MPITSLPPAPGDRNPIATLATIPASTATFQPERPISGESRPDAPPTIQTQPQTIM
ncbi:MAG: hypothetical protein IPL62_13190 [Caulobacteraceae bacterium]|nr:hypothetical protein [Caulobacteraceae bacterium]